MPYTDAAKNSMLASLVGKTAAVVVDALSIHTADPGTTGANEVSSGSYERISVTESDFGTPASGEVVLSGDKQFAAGANEDAQYFGAWDGSTFVGGGAITGDTTFNAEGVFVLKAGTKFDLNA